MPVSTCHKAAAPSFGQGMGAAGAGGKKKLQTLSQRFWNMKASEVARVALGIESYILCLCNK